MEVKDPVVFLSEERIRSRALQLYAERGRGDGHALDDWLRAEKDLTDSYLEECFQALARSLPAQPGSPWWDGRLKVAQTPAISRKPFAVVTAIKIPLFWAFSQPRLSPLLQGNDLE